MTDSASTPSLSGIPPEARLRIYQYLFATSTIVPSRSQGHSHTFYLNTLLSSAPSILFTCRLIYAEAAFVFYEHTTFEIRWPSLDLRYLDQPSSWGDTGRKCAAIHNLVVKIPYDYNQGKNRNYLYYRGFTHQSILEAFPHMKKLEVHLGWPVLHGRIIEPDGSEPQEITDWLIRTASEHFPEQTSGDIFRCEGMLQNLLRWDFNEIDEILETRQEMRKNGQHPAYSIKIVRSSPFELPGSGNDVMSFTELAGWEGVKPFDVVSLTTQC